MYRTTANGRGAGLSCFQDPAAFTADRSATASATLQETLGGSPNVRPIVANPED